VTTELQELIAYVSYLYIRWKLEGFNCAHNRNGTISRLRFGCRTISRLRTGAALSRDCVNPVHNLEIGTQFRDSENAQHNLEIAQIPKLRGTIILLTWFKYRTKRYSSMVCSYSTTTILWCACTVMWSRCPYREISIFFTWLTTYRRTNTNSIL